MAVLQGPLVVVVSTMLAAGLGYRPLVPRRPCSPVVCGGSSAVAGVDDAEAIPLWIREHDEVGVRRIRVPPHAGGAETDQTFDLAGLF